MLSATSTAAPVVARAAPAAARSARGAVGSQSSRGVGARGAVWRVARGASSPARGRASVAARASASRGASKRRSRRDRPPVLRAAGEEPGEAPAGGDDAKASAGSDDAEAQFKTGLGSDPAFDAALASVSDMASDAAPRDPAEEKPRELTKEDFVAPSIDWGDTVVRNADASSDDAQAPVTFSAADLAGDAPAAVPPASGSSPSLAERAMAQSAADGFAPAAAPPAEPAPAMAPLSMSSSSEANQTEATGPVGLATLAPPPERQAEQVRSFLYPGEEELPDDVNMTIWEHLEELRDRALVSAGACTAAILLCFCFAKDLVIFLEAPVASEGVRFLQLGPGEYFFTTVKVAGYCGLLLGAPVVLYEGIAYVLPGLTKDERKFLGPIVLGSSVLFYAGIYFAYATLTPAALKFFIGYSSDAVESPARSSTNGPGLTSRRSYTPKFCMTRATAPQFWGPCGAQSTKHTSPSAACESRTSSFQGGATRRGEDGAVSEEAPREPRARRCLLAPPPPPGNDAGRAETPRVPVDASARAGPRRGATRARANSELVNRSAMSASSGAGSRDVG